MAATLSPNVCSKTFNPIAAPGGDRDRRSLAIIAGLVRARRVSSAGGGVRDRDRRGRGRQILLVTVHDKAAGEMVGRNAALGHRGVMARRSTPRRSPAAPLLAGPPRRGAAAGDPRLEALPIGARRPAPGGYRFTPARIWPIRSNWAKAPQFRPQRWVDEAAIGRPSGHLFAGCTATTNGRRRRPAARFRGMLGRDGRTTRAPTPRRPPLVRSRKRWKRRPNTRTRTPCPSGSRAVAGRVARRGGRRRPGPDHLHVHRGTPEFLLGFEQRHPAPDRHAGGNYRSSPQILELANRLVAGAGLRGALVATQPGGPPPRSIVSRRRG